MRVENTAGPGAGRAASLTSWAAILIVLLIAAGLRLHKLDAQSLWYDEGNSARIAERSLQLIIEGAAGDIHPPLFYIALRFWRDLAGGSEFALRALSALCGVLTVALTCRLARSLFGSRRLAGAAGLLAAVSPLAVYYSQEVRMYGALAMIAALTSLLLVALAGSAARATRAPWPAAVIGLGVATAAGLYAHYAYPFVMLAQGIVALLFLIGLRGLDGAARRLFWRCAAAYGLAIVLFLPWLPTAVGQIRGWGVAAQAYETLPAMLDALRWIAAGRTLPLESAALPMLAFLAAAVVGCAHELRLRRRAHDPLWLGKGLAPAILAALPFGLLFAFGLYRESYLKFLLVCAAPLAVLAAAGIEGVAGFAERRTGRRLAGTLCAVAGCALLAAPLAPSLRNLYDNPAYARDDYRGIARLIDAVARPGDAVLFVAPNQWEVFTYYRDPDDPTAPAIPSIYRPDAQSAARQLEDLTSRFKRLFVLYYADRESDPDRQYERWLGFNAHKLHEEWIGNIRMAVYGRAAAAAVSPAPGVRFGDLFELRSAQVDPSLFDGNQILPVALTLRAVRQPERRYKIFIHVGPPDGAPVAQHDGEPVGGFLPTTEWAPGVDVVDRSGVWLKPGTPAGQYDIYAGMYDAETGERLPLTVNGQRVSGDRLKIGQIGR